MPVTRNAYRRFLIIDSMLRHKTYPSKKMIMDKLKESDIDISDSMLEKDLAAMRNIMMLDIIYDRHHNGYAYGDDSTRFDVVFSEDELALIWLAVQQLKPFEYSNVTRSIISSLEKISKRMHISSDQMKYISKKVDFVYAGPNTGMRMTLRILFDALFYRQKVSFRYYKNGEEKWYNMIPLKLIEDDNEYDWHFEGLGNDGTVTSFRVYYISDVAHTGDTYTEEEIKRLKMMKPGELLSNI